MDLRAGDLKIAPPSGPLGEPNSVIISENTFHVFSMSAVGPSVFFIRVTKGDSIQGMIILINCTFRHCHFNGVQLAGSDEAINTWKKGMTISPATAEGRSY